MIPSKFIMLSLIFVILSVTVSSQETKNLRKKVDSLLHAVNSNKKEDTVKLNQYRELYNKYISLNKKQEVENYAAKTIELAQELNQKAYITEAYIRLGAYYHGKSYYLLAEEYYLKAIAEFAKIDDKKSIAGIYMSLSTLYANIPDYAKALDANFKAVDIYTQINNLEGVAGCYVNIAETYIGLKQHSDAAHYLEKALKIFLSHNGNEYGKVACYVNLGQIYFEVNDEEVKKMGITSEEKYDKALWYLQKAEQIKSQNLSGYINQIRGNVYRKLNKKSLALQAYSKALQYFKQNNITKERATTSLSLANFYIDDAEYQKAAPLLSEALKIGEEYKLPGLQRDAFLALSVMNEKQGLYNNALKYHKEHIAFKEQVFNEEKEKEITRKQLQLDFSIKEKDYQTQQRFQQKLAIFLSVFILVLAIAALLVYKAQRKTTKLNQLVLSQKEELENLGKVKDRIFSVVSHDMRIPVNSLISFINLLENGNVSEEKLKRYAANLKNSLGYTSIMMENLLNWAASQLEGYKPHIEHINIMDCVADIIDAQQVHATEKNITIKNNIPTDLKCQADYNMLNLVVRNLLSNAIKFTHASGFIELSAMEKTNEVQIAVKDNGVGLAEEEVERFNAVSQYGVNKTTLGTNKEKGTGIGLSLCKTFVHLMNGKISLKSDLNKGCTFLVNLPK